MEFLLLSNDTIESQHTRRSLASIRGWGETYPYPFKLVMAEQYLGYDIEVTNEGYSVTLIIWVGSSLTTR